MFQDYFEKKVFYKIYYDNMYINEMCQGEDILPSSNTLTSLKQNISTEMYCTVLT